MIVWLSNDLRKYLCGGGKEVVRSFQGVHRTRGGKIRFYVRKASSFSYPPLVYHDGEDGGNSGER